MKLFSESTSLGDSGGVGCGGMDLLDEMELLWCDEACRESCDLNESCLVIVGGIGQLDNAPVDSGIAKKALG